MRKQQLTMFVSLLLTVGAAAQTPSQLDRVNVVRDTDNIRVEMSSKGAIAPKVSTLDSPARIVVDLPGT
ncbi:MAG: AMIN domain-containing protein, partial [Candidatus Sulfotelmatobacter sp.]